MSISGDRSKFYAYVAVATMADILGDIIKDPSVIKKLAEEANAVYAISEKMAEDYKKASDTIGGQQLELNAIHAQHDKVLADIETAKSAAQVAVAAQRTALDNECVAKRREIAAAHSSIVSREAVVAEKEHTVSSHAAVVEARERVVVEREGKAQEKEKAHKDRDANLSFREKSVEDREFAVAAREDRLKKAFNGG